MERNTLVYRPAPSWGWLSLTVLALVMAMAVLPGLFAGSWLLALVFLPLPAVFLALLIWFPSIRYELSRESLVMRYGPWSWTIRLADIEAVSRRDLAPSMWSTMRLPGFAMFEVIYADAGKVRMCATRAVTDITFIVAGKRQYGVTPLEQDEFEARLREYLTVAE
jgi:hypothetical protein